MGPRARTATVLAAVTAVAAITAAGVFALTRPGDGTATTANPRPSPIVTEGPSPGPAGPGTAGDASPGPSAPAPGTRAGSPGVPPVAPVKIAAAKATPAQVEEAFVAMSAARLCAVQSQAFQTRGELEQQAATASRVALSTLQTKALAKRLATDPGLAKRVSDRFRATCAAPSR